MDQNNLTNCYEGNAHIDINEIRNNNVKNNEISTIKKVRNLIVFYTFVYF